MKKDVATPAFAGFSPAAFRFLKELKETQDREWFQAHKAEYEKNLKQPLAALVTALSTDLKKSGVNLLGDPARSVFRIHRDIRFSNDKSPFKTHVSAVLTPDGDKGTQGLLYIHIDPEGSFVAAGFYCPDKPEINAIRRHIAAHGAEFKAVVASLKKAGLAMTDDQALKRTPPGYEEVVDEEARDMLRFKSFVIRRPLSRKLVGDGDGLVKELVGFARVALPLLNFGWEGIRKRTMG